MTENTPMADNTTPKSQQATPNNNDENSIVDLLMKYLAFWPWIVGSAIVCVFVAFIWLRFQTPIYSTSTSVLIKENDQTGNSRFAGLEAMQNMGMMSMTSNFDNELEVLKSRTLIEKVVSDLNLYTKSFLKRSTGYDLPLYKNEPFEFYMSPDVAAKLPGGIRIDSKYTDEKGLVSEIQYVDESGNEKLIRQTFKHFPSIWSTDFGVIYVNDSLFAAQQKAIAEATKGEKKEEGDNSFEMYTIIQTPVSAALGFKGSLSVGYTSKTTTIAAVSVSTISRQMGEDFLNHLVYMYNMDANDEKNQVAMRTAEFIESRLRIINSELGETDSKMASFKQQSGLTDLTSDAQLALQENSKYEQMRTNNEMQINLVKYLRDYINDPVNKDDIIPANVGLTDVNLTTAIAAYNAVITERRKLLQTASEDNPAVQRLTVGVDAARATVKTTVESVLKGLNITKANLERESYKYAGRISNAPTQEKEFLDIKRQQDIKAALYTTLLGKREENAINLSAVANNGRMIEKPLSSSGPVAPRRSMILLIALIIGIALPIAVIYLRELFQFNISKMEDIKRITRLSIIGTIPNAKKALTEGSSIVVHENKNNTMEEAFRRLRTNILFMLEPGENVIMITSSIPGEGKSLITANLACSLAHLGKKTLVMGADIRRPGLNNAFGLPKRAKGLTNHLSNPESHPLSDLIYHSEISPNLDILFGGSIPPNPTELLSRPIFEETLNELRGMYDYIVMDSAPIGMTTDSNIIARSVDVCLYVCRIGFTPKAAFNFINETSVVANLKKPGIIANDLELDSKSYNYKRGYRYGYNYNYSYSFGYGYGFEEQNKKEDEERAMAEKASKE